MKKVIKYIDNFINKVPIGKELIILREIAQHIGNYYVSINGGFNIKESYIKATEDVKSLGITKIRILGNSIFRGMVIAITITRPRLLIGRGGVNIDKLTEYLSKELKKKVSIDIIEENVIGNLIPYMPYSDSDMESVIEGT
jgi:hypothetical protein